MTFWHLRLLVYGICRIIKPSGHFDGLLNFRFLLVFGVCLTVGASKGIVFGFIVTRWVESSIKDDYEAILLVSILFLPQLLTSLFATVGCSVNSLKFLFEHPEATLLPTGRKYIQDNMIAIVSFYSDILYLCQSQNSVWWTGSKDRF